MKATFAGHPLHPQLIGLPVALLPTSLALDVMAYVTRKKSYRDAAYYTLFGGYAGGMAAASAGIIDYFAIPSGTQAKKVANGHLLLNAASMGLFGMSLLFRRGQREARPKPLPLLLSVAGNVGIGVSSWLGGELVYRHHVRVEGQDPIGQARELKVPGDDALAEVFHRVGDLAPGQVQNDGAPSNYGAQAEARRQARQAS